MTDIDEVLVPRLARGSHTQPDKGVPPLMCGWERISWEQGEYPITSWPAGVSRTLAAFGRMLNDRVCTHTDHGDLLCPPCSMGITNIAHTTLGTAGASVRQCWSWAGQVVGAAWLVAQGTDRGWNAGIPYRSRLRPAPLLTTCMGVVALREVLSACLARAEQASYTTEPATLVEAQEPGEWVGYALASIIPDLENSTRVLAFGRRAVGQWHRVTANTQAETYAESLSTTTLATLDLS